MRCIVRAPCTYASMMDPNDPNGFLLKRLADALEVSSDYLLEGATKEAAKARFEDRELLRQFQEVAHLPAEDKNVVKKLLDAFLTKKHLQTLAR